MKHNPIRLAALIIAASVLAAACTDSSATPTTTGQTSSPAPASPTTSAPPTTSASPSTSSAPSTSKPTSTSPTTKTTTKPSTTKPTPTSISVPPADERFTVAIPDTLSTKEKAAAKAGIAVFRGMQDTSDRALIAPKAKDWNKVMAAYLADPALAAWRIQTYEPALKYDFHQVGYTSVDGDVTDVDLTPREGFAQSVSIDACMDTSEQTIVDENGKPLDASGARQVVWSAVVENLPKTGWRIRTLIKTGSDGKAIKC